MKRTSVGPTDPTTPRQTDQASVFRVEPAGVAGWVVYLVGDPKTHGFLSQQLAATYAQKLAGENKPSVVIVKDTDGTVVRRRRFPGET